MKHLNLTPELYKYMLDISVQEHPALAALREATATHQLAGMQISPEQAQFMQFLLKLNRASLVLELGTFTGYSALAMALALPDNGKVITCDINEEWTKNAATFWQQAGVDEKIDLRLAPALDTLNRLVEHYPQQFDFIFIDADKTNYVNYYEIALQLIKPSGIIAIDNVLWDGHVIDNADHTGQTREIRRLNDLLKNDSRVYTCLLPIADGLFLITPK